MRLIAYSQLSDVRQEVDLKSDILRIGRDPANDLELPSQFVSREHARLIRKDGEFFIENVGLNGTLVDGNLVSVGEQVKIDPGPGNPHRRVGPVPVGRRGPEARRGGPPHPPRADAAGQGHGGREEGPRRTPPPPEPPDRRRRGPGRPAVRRPHQGPPGGRPRRPRRRNRRRDRLVPRRAATEARRRSPRSRAGREARCGRRS